MLPQPGYYWPPASVVDDNDSIDALKRVFAHFGYEEFDNAHAEVGFEKIALYASEAGEWLHAALQDPTGEWKSKLGSGYDIRHKTPHCLEGPLYGVVVCIMRRPRLTS